MCPSARIGPTSCPERRGKGAGASPGVKPRSGAAESVRGHGPRPRNASDESPAGCVTSLVVAFGFSVGLGVATVAIPLLALDAGYDEAAVGFLVATSAAAQLGTRLILPPGCSLAARPNLIAVASVLMLSGFALLLGSTALPVFVAAQLFQGTARAIFWTGSQTPRSGAAESR